MGWDTMRSILIGLEHYGMGHSKINTILLQYNIILIILPCDKQKQICDHKGKTFCWWCCVSSCIVLLTLCIHYFTSPP